MIGAIIGDVVGSRFEFDNYKSKDFEMFDKECDFTDDGHLCGCDERNEKKRTCQLRWIYGRIKDIIIGACESMIRRPCYFESAR